MAAVAQSVPARVIDSATLRAIIEMQLEDSEEMARRDKRKHREVETDDAQIALDLYLADLRESQALLDDRDMAQSMALAILRDGQLIHEHFRTEQQLASDRELALRLSRGEAIGNEEPRLKRQARAVDPWQDAEMLQKVSAIYMGDPEDETVQDSMVEDASVENMPMPEGGEGNDDGTVVAESSSWAAARAPKGDSRRRPCIACGDHFPFYRLARVPCKHEYCPPCLTSLFSLSMKDESLFPPRCDGQEIPLDLVRFFLSSTVISQFEAKYTELSTQDRTYCHDRGCATFIPKESHGDNVATCPTCQRTTCTACKSPSHSGDCPADEPLQQLLELAENSQWQRCYNCHRFVDLVHGCNHMSCRCGAQFCYNCGERWKTCGCPESHYDRLRGRAIQLINRDPHRRIFQPDRVEHEQPAPRSLSPSYSLFNGSAVTQVPPRSHSPSLSFIMSALASAEAAEDLVTRPPSPMAELPQSTAAITDVGPSTRASTPSLYVPGSPAAETQVDHESTLASPDNLIVPAPDDADEEVIAQAIAYLQQNHDCTHGKWRWIRGSHRCEECHKRLPAYIFECRQCLLQACNTCRRNRL